jgi:hypothetical protein
MCENTRSALCVHISSALNCEAKVGYIELVARGMHAINVGLLENLVDVPA